MCELVMALSLALVSAAFGQETGTAAPTEQGIGITLMPPAAPTSMPVVGHSVLAKADEADLSRRSALAKGEGHWWISETIDQSRKGQPVFFGVRLANAPQAALVETYNQCLIAGETLAIRLWGCNDLPREFKGRARVAFKRGNEQIQNREETVRLAPETVKRLAKYSFDTEDLTAGQYTLETSLFDNADELVQQQVTTVTIQVTQKQELSRQCALAKAEAEAVKKAELKAKAESEKQAAAEAKVQAKAAEKAKKEAELKAKADQSRLRALAKADLSRRSALAKAEAEKQAVAADLAKQAELKAKADLSRRSALAKAEADAVKKAELKAKAESEKQAAAEAKVQAKAAEAAKKSAEQKLFEDTKAKYMVQEKAAIAVKAAALAQQEAEYQAKVAQAEADEQSAEIKASALALEAQNAQSAADTKAADEKRMKQLMK